MIRKPEHLAEDPTLREPFIHQISLDEFYVGLIRVMLENDDWRDRVNSNLQQGITLGKMARSLWEGSLDPDTNRSENLYLGGVTDYQHRLQIVEQEMTGLQNALVERGILSSRALEDEMPKWDQN